MLFLGYNIVMWKFPLPLLLIPVDCVFCVINSFCQFWLFFFIKQKEKWENYRDNNFIRFEWIFLEKNLLLFYCYFPTLHGRELTGTEMTWKCFQIKIWNNVSTCILYKRKETQLILDSDFYVFFSSFNTNAFCSSTSFWNVWWNFAGVSSRLSRAEGPMEYKPRHSIVGASSRATMS